MNIDDRRPTDQRPTTDRPQGQFTHFGKISNGHNSATRHHHLLLQTMLRYHFTRPSHTSMYEYLVAKPTRLVRMLGPAWFCVVAEVSRPSSCESPTPMTRNVNTTQGGGG